MFSGLMIIVIIGFQGESLAFPWLFVLELLYFPIE
jgi:hypothetical protein